MITTSRDQHRGRDGGRLLKPSARFNTAFYKSDILTFFFFFFAWMRCVKEGSRDGLFFLWIVLSSATDRGVPSVSSLVFSFSACVSQAVFSFVYYIATAPSRVRIETRFVRGEGSGEESLVDALSA